MHRVHVRPAGRGCCLISLLLLPFRIILIPLRILIAPRRRYRRWR